MSHAKLKQAIANEFFFYGLTPNEVQVEAWARELGRFSADQVIQALSTLRKNPEQKRPPLPAVISDAIMPFLSADEAWSWVPASEDHSTVWCDEIAAAFETVRHIQDQNAARFAFKGAYEREVMSSRGKGRGPTYFFSAGNLKSLRNEPLMRAVRMGLITAEKAKEYVPDLPVSISVDPNKKLLTTTYDEDAPISEEQRKLSLKYISELKALLNKMPTINNEGESE